MSAPGGTNRNVVLAICCMSLFIVGLDVSALNLALPSIRESLGASDEELQWILDAYTVVLAGLLLLSGSIADRVGLEVPKDKGYGHGKLVEELWEHLVGDKLDEPVFVRDFPVETSPLVRSHRTIPGVVEKWDLYVRGFELATGYSELVDPVIQRQRLTEQSLAAAGGDPEAMELDEDFLTALEYGMPPTGGLGIGLDRLVMLATRTSMSSRSRASRASSGSSGSPGPGPKSTRSARHTSSSRTCFQRITWASIPKWRTWWASIWVHMSSASTTSTERPSSAGSGRAACGANQNAASDSLRAASASAAPGNSASTGVSRTSRRGRNPRAASIPLALAVVSATSEAGSE